MDVQYGTNFCRLCLDKNNELMDIFKRNDRNGLVVAQVISELFHVIVSRDDNYPKVICKECQKKLFAFYRMKSKFTVYNTPSFVLFRNQSQIVSSTIDYAKSYNVATPDYQHSPVSWDHSPLSLELEELAAEEELQARRVAVDKLLNSVAQILKNIRSEAGLWAENEVIAEGGSENEEVPVIAVSVESSYNEESKVFSSNDVTLLMSNGEGVQACDGSDPSPSLTVRRSQRRLKKHRELQRRTATSSPQERAIEDSHCVKEEKEESSQRCSSDLQTNASSKGRGHISKALSGGRVVQSAGPSTAGGYSSVQCYYCNKKYNRLMDLKRHLIKLHQRPGEGGSALRKSAVGKKPRSNKESMWEKMMVDVDGEEGWIRCVTCGIRFTCLADLKDHILVPDPQQEKRGSHRKKRIYNCCLCAQSFKWLVMLERHAKTQHSNKRPHVCKECGAAFKLEKYLKKHSKLHTDAKTVECKDCGKMFQDWSQLRLHAAVHTEEEVFECGDCRKKFRAKHLLRIHLRIHDKSNHIQCPECPRKFTQRSDLKKHMVQHSGVRDFKCPDCDKKFLYKRNLNSHVRLHQRLKVALYQR